MRSTGAMNMGACVGLKQTIAANRSGSGADDNYRTNAYMGKDFYSDENFRAALERMDGGYDTAMDLIELMEDYCEIEQSHSRALTTHANKWTSRLNQQSTLASYHTTKRAQHDTVKLAKRLAAIDESRCKAIQTVIDKFRKQVNDTYVSGRLGRGHVHRRTSEFKKLFKTAHASLVEVAKQLDQQRAQETRAREDLRKADSAREIVDSDSTATDAQKTRAENLQKKRQVTLTVVEKQVEQARDAHKTAKRSYRKKVKDIFQQCQHIEEERLEHIKETLLDLAQAMHSEKYAPNLQTIYDDLMSNITTKQNSFDDLLFWAQAYGVLGQQTMSASSVKDVDDEDDDVPTTPIDTRPTTRSTRNSKKSVTDETENLTTNTHVKTTKNITSEDKQQTVADDEEEPSVAIASANSTVPKTKPKRTKGAAAADKKNNTGAEPSSPTATAPHPV